MLACCFGMLYWTNCPKHHSKFEKSKHHSAIAKNEPKNSKILKL